MGMELTHEFTVPVSVDTVWDTFTNDIETVASCFPGATVTSADENGFEGTCKLKLGPIALVYKGTGTFVEKDEASHSMRIEAKGRDRRGNGTASVDVAVKLDGDAAQTTVQVVTDLAITGKPAQFGRGMMQDVSDMLLEQFVECVKTKLSPQEAAAEEPAAEEPAAEAATAASQPEASAPGDSGTPETGTVGAASAPQPPPRVDDRQRSAASEPSDTEDTLDLGTTVLPMLIKMYGKRIAAVAAGVVVIVLVWRGFRRSS